MRIASFVVFVAILTFSCNSVEEKHEVAEGVERTVVQVSDIADGMNRADLGIAGMSCEVMCGTAIRKALVSVPGVHSTEIKFDVDADVNHAIVTFDPNIASDKDMIAAVTSLYGGVYQVKEIQIEQPSVSKPVDSGEIEAKSQKGVETELPSMQMPDLMDVLSQILRI